MSYHQSYTLTITKAYNRVLLIKGFRKLDDDMSLPKAISLADNLPYTKEYCFDDPEKIQSIFDGAAEYSYLKSTAFYTGCSPRETPEAIEALAWYTNLPEEDKRKIDILIRANQPYG